VETVIFASREKSATHTSLRRISKFWKTVGSTVELRINLAGGGDGVVRWADFEVQ
jgi:hypothetical protein